MSLTLYKPLGSNDDKERLDAAKQLSSELSDLIAGEKSAESEKSLNYALKRLTRGLASGANSSRPGFSVVLTELVRELLKEENSEKWGIKHADVLKAVVDNTACQGGISGQEERDHWLGRMFGLESLMLSGAFFGAEWKELLERIFEVANKKPWLSETAAFAVAKAQGDAEVTWQMVQDAGLAKTGEGVGIWLSLAARGHQIGQNPLSMKKLMETAKVLKESGSEEEGIKSKGSWNAKLGFVWDLCLDVYFGKDEAGVKKTSVSWDDFWRVVIDESLFANSSSAQRKTWGFQFFIKALNRVETPEQLTLMFSKNFMRTLINQLADEDRQVHAWAVKVSNVLASKSETTSWIVPTVFKQLATNNGTPNFDKLTKTKTIDKVLCNADEAGLLEIIKELYTIIINPIASTPDVEDATKVCEVRRQWAADQILSVIRNGKTVKAESWLRKVVELFVTFGYFEITDKKKKPAHPVTTTSQGMFRARLMSCLTHLIGLKDVDSTETWPYMAIQTINALSAQKKSYNFTIDLDEQISEALDKARNAVEKLHSKRAADKTDFRLLSFELLYSLVILQVYNGESDALGVLEDLQSIQKQILTSKVEDTEMEMEPSEVLVDILLSFLSKQSMLLKRLAHTVFTSFCSSITRAGIERCFEVLETKEGLEGQSELFDEENDEDEGDDSEDDDVEELDSDVEMLSLPEVEAGSNASDSEDDDEEASDVEIEMPSDSEDDDMTPTEATLKLEADLKAALYPGGEPDSDSDADLDDEAMLKMDDAISAIFKNRKEELSKRKQKKLAKELIVTFKAKILELLEILVKTRPTAAMSLEIILPCLKLARETRDNKLQEKALNTIRAFAHASKREGLPVLENEEDKEAAWKILEFIHEEASKNGGPRNRRATASSASILVVRTLVANSSDNLDRISEIYAKNMVRWVKDPKLGIDNAFFTDFVGWAGSVRGKLDGEKKQEEGETKEEEAKPQQKGKKGKKQDKKRKLEEDEEDVEMEDAEPVAKANGQGKKNKNKRKKRKGGKN
ncbi:DNA polymerase phi-domain-containing protein [Pyronema omphalodes]|nr:DNA polymerase phi-domain-containing protein [Pyronema omphalodes]